MDYYCPVNNGNNDDFRSLAISDADLRSSLWPIMNRDDFVESAIKLARSRGIDISPSEIEGLMREGKKQWLERWI